MVTVAKPTRQNLLPGTGRTQYWDNHRRSRRPGQWPDSFRGLTFLRNRKSSLGRPDRIRHRQCCQRQEPMTDQNHHGRVRTTGR